MQANALAEFLNRGTISDELLKDMYSYLQRAKLLRRNRPNGVRHQLPALGRVSS